MNLYFVVDQEIEKDVTGNMQLNREMVNFAKDVEICAKEGGELCCMESLEGAQEGWGIIISIVEIGREEARAVEVGYRQRSKGWV